MDHLKDKVVIITGASSGIGRATALDLASRGAIVVLGARRIDRIEALVTEIETAGGRAAGLSVDVRDRGAVGALVDLALDRFGRLDVFVSNAGAGPISALDKLDEDGWAMMVDVNLKGVLHGIGAALPVFRRQGSGQFVTVISTAGLRVVPTQAVYAATKNAVRTLMEGLRQEAGPHLRVTGISPGYVATEFTAGITDPDVKANAHSGMADLALPPEAVAAAIRFAIDQPAAVDVGDIVLRPTAQG
ncbi:SDR family oxidoreductase [Falsirhodobacter sp. 1013]|uniref:SDR family oxidoreductase n=1 Tax=Falsirhodobacter sp. 1013 TaxID=3417566 RepID=UPI003EBE152C